MSYRTRGITALAGMLAAVLLASGLEEGGPARRVHQHRTARPPEAGCDCDGRELCTHLPLVMIDTGGQEIPGVPTGETDAFGETCNTTAPDGRNVISARLTLLDQPDGNNHPSDEPVLETAVEIGVRGHSSRSFEKSPYRLTLVDEQGEKAPEKVLGMAAHGEWVLHGPYLDKSLMRNYLWYNLAGEAMEWAPNVRYCELLLNGEYQGLYLMVETVANGDGCRLNLRESTRDTGVTGYLLRGDRTTQEDLGSVRDPYTYLERMGILPTDLRVEYPGRGELTEELRRQIELDYSGFERALYSYDYDTGRHGYWNYIDEESFVNYFWINEFSGNVDAGRYSTYLYKDLKGRYQLAVWDFNNACDNFPADAMGPEGLEMVEHTWFFMLCKSERFVERLLARYDELRQTILSEESLCSYLEETLAYLGPAVERNQARWAQAVTQWAPLDPVERNRYSHEEAVEQLKTWLLERGRWLDAHVHTLRQYSHPSRTKDYDP